ncbi:hypothetical protein FOB58_003689 [Candida parapsilosis]|uniref:Uncharacterized protein n=2 Tax=Candida parapsilosis TaxID=5480 RepID=G8BIP9_CANPC|nr:uncharacterized protein CPAR2_403160 [Candida parapsilosis]KAF6047211.1 hypothetical protein FOB60_004747 [Candida parapsilosis]KAF6047611.1 hypothetical protein FOB58_003689 [Candida parapsilosis]KAF6050421.1 hypothetical protein FOB59_002667 [Candida parapsilosis]KAF6061542.1 hypothetical protein FOB61_004299 [Candida parapsilosis]KAI5901772.1 hypothetical protein K4G60_g911 [Candida parapsilosis]
MSKHEESLIEEAEEVDPSIAQLPPHKVNKAESKKDPEEAFAGEQEEQSPAVDEKFQEEEREVSEWNIEHGFKDPKESLLQEAEDADPNIVKLPAHKVDGTELKQETSPNPEADEIEQETYNDDKLKAEEEKVTKWNAEHGFKDTKESLIEEAEEADPNIVKLPPHKVNKKELEEELGKE